MIKTIIQVLLFALLFLFAVGVIRSTLWERYRQKRIWNRGICASNGRPWRRFSTTSCGKRGYKAGGQHYCWIDFDVDKIPAELRVPHVGATMIADAPAYFERGMQPPEEVVVEVVEEHWVTYRNAHGRRNTRSKRGFMKHYSRLPGSEETLTEITSHAQTNTTDPV